MRFKFPAVLVAGISLFAMTAGSGNPSLQTAPNAPGFFNPGPDIITGDIGQAGGLVQSGSEGTQVGLGVSTSCCNAGNVPVNFFELPDTRHPVIPHNLYRMSGGAGNSDRFEQIGQSWVKHAFGANALDDCNFGCQPSGDISTHLGVGCSDTYSADQNATPNLLGSRALLNPFTGVFQSTASNHSGHTHTGTSHRILVESSDLNTTINPGATYYVEVQYIASDEYAWCQTHPGECNMYNNSSYRRFNVSGTASFAFSEVGPTVKMAPAVTAWSGATINQIEPAPGVDGRAFMAYKVTGPVAGLWHYEYAIYNENLDRGIQSFSVPLGCGVAVNNPGFHAPLNHPGFPNDGTQGDAGFSNTAWTANQSANDVSWSTDTFVQNQNANAIRWGTLYNFRFDSGHAPVLTNATIGFFKTGTPITVGILAPNACNIVPTPTPTPNPTPTAAPTATPVPTPTPISVPTPILPPGGNGKIAFVRNNNEIFVMDADGATQTNVTNNPGQDYDPAWSPDGTKIAFSSDRSGHTNIYVMNANGSNPTRLTSATQIDAHPVWSPDGTKIAFSRAQNIYVMNANGSNQIPLTNSGSDTEPAWSPDGGKIAFTSYRDGNYEIYVMNANGSNPTNFTNNQGPDNGPAWSPDGTKIAFFTMNAGLFVMNADGSNPTRIPNSSNADEVGWSPDGTKIVFGGIEQFGDSLQIVVMNVNGSNRINLTNNSFTNAFPVWQRIAPVPSPTPAAQAINLSTRLRVQTGDNVGIGGFIITGSAPKHVLLRAIGPSLTQFGVDGALADPVMELHGPGAFATITSDNWRSNAAQEAAILATGIPPSNDLESSIDATLAPGAYTAIVKGSGNTAGAAVVEVYDLNPSADSKLANISTRAFVSTGDNIVIAGFILGNRGGDDRIVVRGIGPSLTATGVSNALADAMLELRDSNGALLTWNNDWQDNAAQATELTAAGLALSNNLESGIAMTLPPGRYTALLAGVNNGVGVGLVEVYDRGP